MSNLSYAVRIDDAPPAECTHFSDRETAQAYYNAVVTTVWAGKYDRVSLLHDGQEISRAVRTERPKENE